MSLFAMVESRSPMYWTISLAKNHCQTLAIENFNRILPNSQYTENFSQVAEHRSSKYEIQGQTSLERAIIRLRQPVLRLQNNIDGFTLFVIACGIRIEPVLGNLSIPVIYRIRLDIDT